MLGCHNCRHQPRKDENYEDTACSKCRAAMDPALLSGYGNHSVRIQNLKTLPPSDLEEYPDAVLREHYCREDMAAAVSETVKIILRLKIRNRSTWRILEMKINRPELTYSQLADIFSCRKQNIQYHLHKILSACPELGYLLPAARKKSRRTAHR